MTDLMVATANYARAVAKHAAERQDEIDYTESDLRWSGIDHGIEYPRLPPHCDCSAFVTWVFWTARIHMRHSPGVDIVNGQRWQAGFTGTMIQHGARHRDNHPGRWKKGRTAVFYADRGSEPTHVALWVDDIIWTPHLGSLASLRAQGVEVEEHNGHAVLMNVVISHGQDAGPQVRAWKYRRIVQARAYPL